MNYLQTYRLRKFDRRYKSWCKKMLRILILALLGDENYSTKLENKLYKRCMRTGLSPTSKRVLRIIAKQRGQQWQRNVTAAAI